MDASCVVVVDAGGRPVGILTEGDVARRVVFRVPPETQIETLMTAPVLTIPRREYLYAAIAAMRRHGLRHLPIVDRDGRLAGLIRLHDALAAAAPALLRQIDRLAREDTLDGIKDVKAAQVELAEELLAEQLPATEIQQLLTRINNDLYRRVGEAVLRAMANEGWGDPPASAATIVMGSGGRGENYLLPDQDNGFIVADYPDDAHGRIDAFFQEAGGTAVPRPQRDWHPLLQRLLHGGKSTVAQDAAAMDRADRHLDPARQHRRRQACRHLLRLPAGVGGDGAGARAAAAVTGLVRNNRTFLRQMYQDKLEHSAALGIFGGFVVERENREYRGQVNLKYTGTLPLVSGIRLLALREGVEETSTLARIRRAGRRGRARR